MCKMSHNTCRAALKFPLLFLLLQLQPICSTTTHTSHNAEELKLKKENQILKQLILQQLVGRADFGISSTPDITPSFKTPDMGDETSSICEESPSQLEDSSTPTPTLWSTSVYTSIHFSTTTVNTTTLIPINVGRLTGHTYTVVNTLTQTITSTATLTSSIKVTEISPTSTQAEISPTCSTGAEISPTSTRAEISPRSSSISIQRTLYGTSHTVKAAAKSRLKQLKGEQIKSRARQANQLRRVFKTSSKSKFRRF